MREPDTCFLQSFPHDRDVRNKYMQHRFVTFPDGCSQDAPCLMQYFVCACSAIAKDSFAQSIGSEWLQLSILAGVIVFISSVAASFTSSPTALSTRQVSQAACRLVPHIPVTGMLFPPRSSSNET
jgi:hypothetical protein